MKYQDYYQTLGVKRDATAAEIQKAYRKLARKYHPDVNKSAGAEDTFKKINEANEVLGDPQKRQRYVQLGANWQAGQDFRPPPGYEHAGGSAFNFGGGAGGAQFSFEGANFAGGDFSDFFSAIFGGGGASPFGGAGSYGGADPFAQAQGKRHEPQADEAELPLSIEELLAGGKKRISLQAMGGADGDSQVKTLDVTIPKGTTSGSAIRLAGQGGKKHSGKGNRDLILRVKLLPHPKLRVNGFDLYTPLNVAPWEAALGAKLPVVTATGEVQLQIPAGIQGGTKMRVRGKGLPMKEGGSGDLYVEISVVTPKELTPRERELFTELSKVSAFNPRG